MAAKTSTCNICHEQVSKPQSYAYNGGRACRTHPEAQAAHEAAEQAKSANLQQHKEAAAPAWKKRFDDPADESFGAVMARAGIRDPHSHCWCCGKDGIYAHIFAERILINMSKSKLNGDAVNPFDPNSAHYVAMRKEIGDKAVIKQFPSTMFKEWQLKQLFTKDRDKIMLTQISGIAILCNECAIEYKIDWSYNVPKMDLKDMLFIGQLIEPGIDKLAAGEMAEDVTKKAMAKES
jgi:hypothetical protein